MKRFLLVNALVCLAMTCSGALAREWTDSTGQKRFQGEFAGWQDGKVVLVGENGVKYGCLPDRLSHADRDYLLSLSAKSQPQPQSQSKEGAGKNQDDLSAAKVTAQTAGTAPSPNSGAMAKTTTTSARRQASDIKTGVEELPLPGAQPVTALAAGRASDAKSAGMEPGEETRTAEASIQPGFHFRYVYYGHHGTYHLTWKLGTAHEFHHCDHTLVGLKYFSADSWYLYYTVDEPGLHNQMYAFARHPHHCKYDVWRKADWHHNGNYFWHRIDCADRVTPHLPHP